MNPKPMNSNVSKQECPDFEFVSAYFDDELDKSSGEYLHILKCSKCQERVSDYSSIAEALRESLNVEEYDTFGSTIRERFRKQQEKNEEDKSHNNSNRFLSNLLKVAAVILIVAIIAYDIYPNSNDPVADTDIPDLSRVVINDAAVIGNAIPENDTSNGIDMSSLKFVSYGDNSNFLDISVNKQLENPIEIQPKVKHVWSVKEDLDINKVFLKLTEKVQIPKSRVKSTLDNKNEYFLLTPTKRQLIQLVRLCKAEGFSLFSSQSPQPEQNLFIGKADDQVIYLAIFLKD